MAFTYDPQPDVVLAPPDCDRLAAHVFACWWLGHRILGVDLVDRPERAGRINGSAIMFPPPIYALAFEDQRLMTFCHANGVRRAEQMLLVIAAGSAAAAGDADCGSGPRAARDGQDAVRTASRVADWVGGDRARNWRIAVKRARALLSAPRVGAAVDELSELLAAKRHASHDEIDRVFSSWFEGWRPFHDAWSESWPPTLEQLREAHVPVYREDEAAVKAMVARVNAAAGSRSAA